jgi:dinuclear metal center YbgI/SA1388 family protein
MLVAEFVAAIERMAPSALAEDWDNVGLLVGRHNQPVSRVLVALELRDEILLEASEHGCDAILTHHPPIFPVLSAVTDHTVVGELVLRAAELRMAVVSAHTNLDAATGGLNDDMAELIGLSATRPLRPSLADPSQGLGRVGTVATGTTLEALVRTVAAAFGLNRPAFVGDATARIATVACCTGSGSSLLPDAVAAAADVYVTSDLTYHDHDRAPGLALVTIPHGRVEQVALKRWARRLERAVAGDGVEVRFALTDTDPWQNS